ncbi:MAG: hypothetical protein Q7U45_03085, partial [Burkholderiaceae bacterium]|nr:hypothetical protein [Burkholderiaceae bacterium]
MFIGQMISDNKKAITPSVSGKLANETFKVWLQSQRGGPLARHGPGRILGQLAWKWVGASVR